MQLLNYVFYYAMAAILLLQGTQLLGELGTPLGTVPAEVKPEPGYAAKFGGFLAAYAVAMTAAGLLSHAYPWFLGSLRLLLGGAVAGEIVFGLWLVFGRKVDYTPAPVAADDHGHGHH